VVVSLTYQLEFTRSRTLHAEAVHCDYCVSITDECLVGGWSKMNIHACYRRVRNVFWALSLRGGSKDTEHSITEGTRLGSSDAVTRLRKYLIRQAKASHCYANVGEALLCHARTHSRPICLVVFFIMRLLLSFGTGALIPINDTSRTAQDARTSAMMPCTNDGACRTRVANVGCRLLEFTMLSEVQVTGCLEGLRV
jgi:hypothetical protein